MFNESLAGTWKFPDALLWKTMGFQPFNSFPYMIVEKIIVGFCCPLRVDFFFNKVKFSPILIGKNDKLRQRSIIITIGKSIILEIKMP